MSEYPYRVYCDRTLVLKGVKAFLNSDAVLALVSREVPNSVGARDNIMVRIGGTLAGERVGHHGTKG